MREVIITSILQGFDKKNHFFEEWSWFKFNNLGLALCMSFKCYTSVAKGLKLKFRKFLGRIPTFVEVTEEKLLGGPFWPPSLIVLRKPFASFASKNCCIFFCCCKFCFVFFLNKAFIC